MEAEGRDRARRAVPGWPGAPRPGLGARRPRHPAGRAAGSGSAGTRAVSGRAGVRRERQICWRRRERCCLAKFSSNLIKGTEMNSGPLKTRMRFNTKITHLTWKVNDTSAARVFKWARGQAGSLVFCSICLRAPRPPLSTFLSPGPDPVLKSCLHGTVYLSVEEGERETISGDGPGERR